MASSQKAMEYIWQNMTKKDKSHITFKEADVDYLYYCGFVDESKFSLEEWKQAFQNLKQKDNSYKINQTQFMQLAKFRYSGPVQRMFDPSKIEEGLWSDEKLKRFFDDTLQKVCSISEDLFWKIIGNLKSQGFCDKKGVFTFNKSAKIFFRTLIEQFPTQKHRRERRLLKHYWEGTKAHD